MRGDEDSVDIYMPWFLGDYWRDTGHLGCLEHGAYLQLLARLWSAKGHLPFDPPRLAQAVSLDVALWPAVWEKIGKFFTVADGMISQKRGLYELEQARQKRQGARERAQAAALERWSKRKIRGGQKGGKSTRKPRAAERDARALLEQCPPSASPSPSSPPPTSGSGGAALARAARAPSLFDWAMTSFRTAWKRRYRQDYVPTAADRSQLGRLLKTLPREISTALPACFERYLDDKSPFVSQEKRHSLAWFVHDSGVNKYRVSAPVVTAKEARTAAALDRFVNGGGDGRAG